MHVARKLSILGVMLALACGAGYADAQTPTAPPFPVEMLKMLQGAQPANAPANDPEACDAPAIATWMPKAQPVDWNSLPNARIDASDVHAVKADVTAAKARLETTDAAPLSAVEAARFTGVALADLKPTRAGLAPYLVRAVFPVPDSEVRMTWYGDYLEVFSVGEGCAPFANTPVVAFLQRAPRQVFPMVANGHGSGN